MTLPLALPAVVPAQQPASPRIRIVVYKLTAGTPKSERFAADVGRALAHALARDSMFLLMSYPGAQGDRSGLRPSAQYAVLGGVVVTGLGARVDLRIVDIANVKLLALQKLAVPDALAAYAAGDTGEQLAKLVHQHFAAARQ